MTRLFLLLLIGISAASTASIFIKLCEAPALIIAAYRMVFASLVLLPFACRQKVWKDWSKAWNRMAGSLRSLPQPPLCFLDRLAQVYLCRQLCCPGFDPSDLCRNRVPAFSERTPRDQPDFGHWPFGIGERTDQLRRHVRFGERHWLEMGWPFSGQLLYRDTFWWGER